MKYMNICLITDLAEHTHTHAIVAEVCIPTVLCFTRSSSVVVKVYVDEALLARSEEVWDHLGRERPSPLVGRSPVELLIVPQWEGHCCHSLRLHVWVREMFTQ